MTIQSVWFRVYAAGKLALAGAVVAGFMGASSPVAALTFSEPGVANGPVIDSYTFPTGFGLGDIWISGRTWDETFSNQAIAISYFLTADGSSTSKSTATALDLNPPGQGTNYGIKHLTLAWWNYDTAELLGVELFSDANGVVIPAILTQVLENSTNYLLQFTGTLLGQGGGYIKRVEAIPLPAGLLLFLSGLAGIGFLGRYKARRREPTAA